MNERIKELAEQAGIDMWINGNDEVELPENQKKFAELIIKECLHIVDDEGAGEGGCIRAMIRIQNEFGVEQ